MDGTASTLAYKVQIVFDKVKNDTVGAVSNLLAVCTKNLEDTRSGVLQDMEEVSLLSKEPPLIVKEKLEKVCEDGLKNIKSYEHEGCKLLKKLCHHSKSKMDKIYDGSVQSFGSITRRFDSFFMELSENVDTVFDAAITNIEQYSVNLQQDIVDHFHQLVASLSS